MNSDKIKELIAWHESVAADGLRIAEASGDKAVKYFGERSAETAAALRAAAAVEREACAQLAESHQSQHEWNQRLAAQIGKNVAAAIRARGEADA